MPVIRKSRFARQQAGKYCYAQPNHRFSFIHINLLAVLDARQIRMFTERFSQSVEAEVTD
jgi:hypothetical protein